MVTEIEAGLAALVNALPIYKLDDNFLNKGDNEMEIKKEGLDVKGKIETKDMVNHPRHYNAPNGMEVIDVIEAFTEGLEGIEATDTGNVIKYICRWHQKNGIEDLRKIIWYTNHLIKHLENKDDKIDITIDEVDASKKFDERETNDQWCRVPFIPKSAKDSLKFAEELCERYGITFSYNLSVDEVSVMYMSNIFRAEVYKFKLKEINKLDIAKTIIDYIKDI